MTFWSLPPTSLHLADVDGLDDVAGLGVDRHRPARALPGHALGRLDQGVAAGVAVGLLQRLVDQVHAVIAADREEVRVAAVVGRLIGGDELLVHRVVALQRVVEGGDDAVGGVAHALERLGMGELALGEELGGRAA